MGRIRRTPPGPYSTPEYKLTPEGQLAIAEWLQQYPRPAALLHKTRRALYHAALRIVGEDELDALCLVGVTKAMLTWNPAVSKFTTYVARAIQNAVFDELRKADSQRAQRYGVRIQEMPVDPDNGAPFDVAESRDQSPAEQCELGIAVESAMRRQPRREQEILRMRFGLDGRTESTLNEVAAIFGISKERVRQLEVRAMRGLRKDLAIRSEGGF